jgi:hypothetical protein
MPTPRNNLLSKSASASHGRFHSLGTEVKEEVSAWKCKISLEAKTAQGGRTGELLERLQRHSKRCAVQCPVLDTEAIEPRGLRALHLDGDGLFDFLILCRGCMVLLYV